VDHLDQAGSNPCSLELKGYGSHHKKDSHLWANVFTSKVSVMNAWREAMFNWVVIKKLYIRRGNSAASCRRSCYFSCSSWS
jgi:hypothetical protein